MKKIISLIMSVVMVITTLFTLAIPVSAQIMEQIYVGETYDAYYYGNDYEYNYIFVPESTGIYEVDVASSHPTDTYISIYSEDGEELDFGYTDSPIAKAVLAVATLTAGETYCVQVRTYIYTDNGVGFTETSIKKHVHSYKYEYYASATSDWDGYYYKKCKICDFDEDIFIPKIKEIKLSQTSYTYDGKVKTPTATIKDRTNKTIPSSNYSLSYSTGRKGVGKYKVTAKFKGNLYAGSISTYFSIKPPATSISKVSAGSKKFTVKWKKQATQNTGYQIQYSTSSKFTSPKSITIKGTSNLSKSVTKLSAKKKYYVRVRTYKTVNKINYYSVWSASKSITTKK